MEPFDHLLLLSYYDISEQVLIICLKAAIIRRQTKDLLDRVGDEPDANLYKRI